MCHRLAVVSLLLALSGCAAAPDWLPLPTARGEAVASIGGLEALTPVVRTPDERRADVSAAAHWRNGSRHWLVATVPERNELRVFDATDGRLLRTVGGESDPAEDDVTFDRPHRIHIVDDIAMVSEQASGRVHLLTLPNLEVALTFGDGDDQPLDQARSLWAVRMADWGYHVYITDDYLNENDALDDAVLGRRVKHYALTQGALGWSARGIRVFGEVGGDGRLSRVDALVGDAANRLLLIADTDPTAGRRAWLYTANGRYAQRSLGGGVFRSGVAGLALLPCGDADQGLWLATDAGPNGHFLHAFDRQTLDHRGSFTLPELSARGSLDIDRGAVGRIYATLADGTVAGFDSAPVRALSPACGVVGSR
jgi:3-phytase